MSNANPVATSTIAAKISAFFMVANFSVFRAFRHFAVAICSSSSLKVSLSILPGEGNRRQPLLSDDVKELVATDVFLARTHERHGRINTDVLPLSCFITAAIYFAMVTATHPPRWFNRWKSA